MTTYTIYADSTDFYVFSGPDTYSGARAGSGLTATTGGSDLTAGQQFVPFGPGLYVLYEAYIGFDTSAVPSGTDSNISVNLNIGTVGLSGKSFEVRESAWTAGNTSSWVAGASLSALTLFGTATVTATGYNAWTTALTAVPRSSLYKLLVCGKDTTDNIAPAMNPSVQEIIVFAASETAGTTSDPKLVFDSVSGGGGAPRNFACIVG